MTIHGWEPQRRLEWPIAGQSLQERSPPVKSARQIQHGDAIEHVGDIVEGHDDPITFVDALENFEKSAEEMFGVMGDIVDTSPGALARVDGGTRDDVIRRGHYSLKNRGKIALLVGAVGAAADLLEVQDKAQQIAFILTKGEGIQRARLAAMRGDISGVEMCLTGMGTDKTTYTELSTVDPLFALAFRAEVVNLLKRKKAQLRALDQTIDRLELK